LLIHVDVGELTMLVATSTPDGDPRNLPGYDILDVVGYEGLAVIYRARQRNLNRIVAIRTIRGEAGSDEPAQFLRREAALLARLQHPHVVSILDCLEHAGRVYLVLEYIEGGTLAARLTGQPQPVRPAVTLIERLARTLHHVHQRGVVHCNLKPAQVLLAGPANQTPGRVEQLEGEAVYGIPLLSGFELALDRQCPGELQEGQIRGTPAYMAPEQARARHQEIGPATDIHGLGAILYQLLTGRPPFQAGTVMDVLMLVMEMEPEPVSKLNPALDRKLEAICQKCLHKDPARRYGSGLELASELRGFVEGLSRRRWF
jgi:serine/threonine protein kinase